MPRNASGVYSQPASSVNPPIAGAVIDPVAFAAALTDLATEITNSLDRLGRGGMTAALPMGGFKITGLGAPALPGDAARLQDATSSVPPGIIAMHGAATPPTGWLECDGSAKSRTTYAALFAAIGTVWGAGDGSTTFNLPEMRGYFPRGHDHGAGIDPSRVFASLQADGFKSHSHTPGGGSHNHTYNSPTGSSSFAAGGTFALTGTTSANTGSTAPVITIGSAGGSETVPKNKAVLFIIRT